MTELERKAGAQVFVTADNHFGHDNIRGYCNRPFDTVEDMDQTMITEWNLRVGPHDVIYHLGDFTMGGITAATQYFRQLNGLIYVLGNYWHHDKRWLRALSMDHLFGPSGLRPVSASGYPIQVLPNTWQIEVEGLLVVLSHFPFSEWDRKHHGSVHFHGHSHGKGTVRSGRRDVGVDRYAFKPMPATAIIEEILGWTRREEAP